MSKDRMYEAARRLYSFIERYIYVFIALLAIIILLTVFVIPQGDIREFALNLSSEFFGASLVFLFVSWISKYDPDKEMQREQRDLLIDMKKAIGSLDESRAEVMTYRSGMDFLSAFCLRISTAKRVDDVTWMYEEDLVEWSSQGRAAYRQLQNTIDEVSRKTDVVWREVVAFYEESRFEQEKKRILAPDTGGYHVAFYDIQSSECPPKIGFAIIDGGDSNAEVFLSSSKVRLSIKHPEMANYFSNYFDLIWSKAIKIKRGSKVDRQLLSEIESKFT